MKHAIYDFETLGQNPKKSAVLSFAVVSYDDKDFLKGKGLDYDQLIANSHYIKFDVADQVKNYGREIDPNTLEWWKSQGETAKKVLKPSADDKPISVFRSWLINVLDWEPNQYERVYTRGNTFDPIFLAELGADPFPWWSIRDTRSYIDALLLGSDGIDNRFVPPEFSEKFVHHDPRHDIVMDIMRMQELTRVILL